MKAIILGILVSIFFAFIFVLNRAKELSIKGVKLGGIENGCKDTFVTTMGKLLR